jgi:hypothetical protein
MKPFTFATTVKLIKRRVNARPLRRAFFMPYSQVIDLFIKLTRLPMALSQNRIPYLNPSFDSFTVNGNGGNRFFCYQINSKTINASQSFTT